VAAGRGLAVSKAVADAAHGGMVVMSGSAYQKLPMEEMWETVAVLHMGEHVLKPELKDCVQLYQVGVDVRHQLQCQTLDIARLVVR
jgi:hypothetical protein